jgi:hypothetical protein
MDIMKKTLVITSVLLLALFLNLKANKISNFNNHYSYFKEIKLFKDIQNARLYFFDADLIEDYVFSKEKIILKTTENPPCVVKQIYPNSIVVSNVQSNSICLKQYDNTIFSSPNSLGKKSISSTCKKRNWKSLIGWTMLGAAVGAIAHEEDRYGGALYGGAIFSLTYIIVTSKFW